MAGDPHHQQCHAPGGEPRWAGARSAKKTAREVDTTGKTDDVDVDGAVDADAERKRGHHHHHHTQAQGQRRRA
jgi:hypothetical protein